MEDLELRETKFGKGVFSNIFLPKNSVILEFLGDKIVREDIPEINSVEDDRYLQIDENLFLGPSHKIDDFVNHSCNPNCGLVFNSERVFLKSIKDIRVGEEIVWDYSTTMKNEDWTMKCLCGSDICRGLIRNFSELPQRKKEEYIKLGIVPDYNVH